MNASRSSTLRAAAVVYLLAAGIYTWPLALHPASRLGAPQGPGDPYLNVWILGWDLRTLAGDPGALLTGRIFDANIFHPARQTLAYSDHLILQALAVLPVYLLTGNLALCYNLVFLLSLVASAVAMHAFIRSVTASMAGAYAAGVIWGFWPYHFAHLIHLQLQALYFLPLAFLFLHRLIAGRRRRDALWLGVTLGLQAVASVYYGVIGAVAIITAAIVLAGSAGRGRSGTLARRLLLAGMVGSLVVAPFAWPYWRAQQREGFGRNLYEAARHAARPISYLSAPPTNLLYGGRGSAFGDWDPDVERQLFPGVIVIALAGVGLWHTRRRDGWPLAIAMAAVAAVGFVLSLGPDGVRPVYAAFHRWFFGFHAIRAPARFGVLVAFGLAALAALGLRELADRGPRARWGGLLAPALVGILALEYANAPIAYVAAPPQSTAVGAWLRDAPGPGAVLYLPLSIDVENTPFMVESLQHGRPIVNGYSGQRPAFYAPLVETISRFPSGESLLTLRDLNVRYLVSPAPVPGDTPALVERARLGGRVVYELVWTPEAEARLVEPEGLPPPPPGPAPFGDGEEAVYEIQWIGMGLGGLAAGEATFGVRAADPTRPADARAAVYTFTLVARTADWVARFFEAFDRFETLADASLLPIRHRQQLREGRRVVDRTVTYDHARHAVRIQREVSLPLQAGARDPLSAFFYVRTLPLAPGYRVEIPVNDLGRSLTLDMNTTGLETIEHGGHAVSVLRVEPRLRSRIERRQPLTLTVWLSRDGRRIPLRADVAAGFGSFRVELVKYRGGA